MGTPVVALGRKGLRFSDAAMERDHIETATKAMVNRCARTTLENICKFIAGEVFREDLETFSEEINESLYACPINDVVVDFIKPARF
jgi:hypothetical protein